MKLNKSKISIVFALVLCMVISIAMPIMSSADESDLYANKRELDVENVVNPVQGMIDYIGDTGKEITMSLRKMNPDGSLTYEEGTPAPTATGTITEILTDLLEAYKADPSDGTLADLAQVVENYFWSGDDAHDVFMTDTLFSYFCTFCDNMIRLGDEEGFFSYDKDENGEKDDYWCDYPYVQDENGNDTDELAIAKRSPAQLVEHILAVDSSLYVKGMAISDYEDEVKALEANMNNAENAAGAYEALYELIDFLNEKCMLKAYLGFEIVLDKMELQTANTTGDAVELETLAFMLDFGRSEFESEADGYLNYTPAGFAQYRPAGQAASFVDDANTATTRLNSYIEELGAISDSYEATVTTPTDFSSVQEKIDLLNNGLNNGESEDGGNTPTPGGDTNQDGKSGDNGNDGPANTSDMSVAIYGIVALVCAGLVTVLVAAKKIYNK